MEISGQSETFTRDLTDDQTNRSYIHLLIILENVKNEAHRYYMYTFSTFYCEVIAEG